MLVHTDVHTGVQTATHVHKQKESHQTMVRSFFFFFFCKAEPGSLTERALVSIGVQKAHVLCCISYTRPTPLSLCTPMCTHIHTHKDIYTHMHTHTQIRQQATLIKHSLSNWHVVILLAPIIKETFFYPNYFSMFM